MNPTELVRGDKYAWYDEKNSNDTMICFMCGAGDLFIFVDVEDDERKDIKMTGHEVRTRIPPIEEPEPENHHEAMRSLSTRVSGQLADMFEELNSSRHSEESEGFITAMLRIIDKAREEIDHRIIKDSNIIDRIEGSE